MRPIKPLPTDPDPLQTGPNKTILPSNTPYMVAGFGRRCVAGFGAPNDTGIDAVERLRPLVPPGATLAQFALKWILSFDAVSCVIPGGRRPDQVRDNAAASDLAPLPPRTIAAVQEAYDDLVRPLVHHRW
jgi:aryl-alcohol dehydrogenase-like predicted oxidoreductase